MKEAERNKKEIQERNGKKERFRKKKRKKNT